MSSQSLSHTCRHMSHQRSYNRVKNSDLKNFLWNSLARPACAKSKLEHITNNSVRYGVYTYIY